jgi:hypothetical protein
LLDLAITQLELPGNFSPRLRHRHVAVLKKNRRQKDLFPRVL